MEQLLKNRTKSLAILVWHNCQKTGNEFYDFKRQLVRCSTSVGANYRAVCRAKSDRDFISKMETVIEEADETLFWLEIIEEANILNKKSQLQELKKEADELVAIFVSSVITIKKRLNKKS